MIDANSVEIEYSLRPMT